MIISKDERRYWLRYCKRCGELFYASSKRGAICGECNLQPGVDKSNVRCGLVDLRYRDYNLKR